MSIKYQNPPALEYLAWALLVALFLLPLFYYGQLPDRIPSHFNASGAPDAFASKASIWILPIIGLSVFLLLHFLSKAEKLKINGGPANRTKEQEEQIQTIGRKMLNALKILIPAAFLYINFSTINTALGKMNGLGSYFLIIFLISIFGVLGYFTYKMYNLPE